MTYQITKEIRILHTKDDWDFVFKTDDDGTVLVRSHEGLEAFIFPKIVFNTLLILWNNLNDYSILVSTWWSCWNFSW